MYGKGIRSAFRSVGKGLRYARMTSRTISKATHKSERLWRAIRGAVQNEIPGSKRVFRVIERTPIGMAVSDINKRARTMADDVTWGIDNILGDA